MLRGGEPEPVGDIMLGPSGVITAEDRFPGARQRLDRAAGPCRVEWAEAARLAGAPVPGVRLVGALKPFVTAGLEVASPRAPPPSRVCGRPLRTAPATIRPRVTFTWGDLPLMGLIDNDAAGEVQLGRSHGGGPVEGKEDRRVGDVAVGRSTAEQRRRGGVRTGGPHTGGPRIVTGRGGRSVVERLVR